MTAFPALRVLLLQARGTEDMESQEQSCFLERTRLGRHQLVAANVVRDAIRPTLLDGMDALLIGGAGEFSATKDYAWTADVLDLIRSAAAMSVPTFGSCWGHQMIARAFGGAVIHDPSKSEMGCFPVQLTADGIEDRLFGAFPSAFLANMGHEDRVVGLPIGAVELARNESQPNQAFRMGDLPVYGTQFHSELDARRIRERLSRYRELYPRELGDDATFDAIWNSLAETTEVDHLLHDFLQRCAVG